ncbi:RNA degradosome polyphosphate kinase [Lachnoanaerobaculum umeaense]|uniref:Polyphosphate kinase n=1 Tax=Lachnoanaerobaculum umeaense TaxID=617123 RepID=A0A385PZ84_9FIRM|nr:RNA degradosome polyphosphate kinase [Lachnoanaerobaculum umeaense]AYA99481.1 RNA degradosome polyphosphate kinase [Lachnoanaerobaculum umeaense]PZW95819.1 polyphosphate kinase [Lachnoanaerobaculum umeaense]
MEKFDNVEYFTNRELSWLKFNIRVLNEAEDDDVKLFERLKFLSITSSNLDEFFMVRIASLKDMVEADYKKKDISGMSADKQLNLLAKETHNFVKKQYEIYNKSLLPLLKKENLYIISHDDLLEAHEKKFISEYFDEFVYPVLTPMAVDASRPFPLVRNKTLNIAALIRKRKDESSKKKKKDVYLGNVDGDMDFAMVQVPSVLPRIVEIPSESDERKIIYLEDIIEKNIDKLFLNYEVISAATFRVMRNAEFKLDEDEALDLLEEIKKKLKKRQWGEAIRLEVEERMDTSLLQFLKSELNIEEEDIFRINGPLDLTAMMKIYSLDGFDRLKDKKHIPVMNSRLVDCEDIFDEIKKKDILLSHPYESFDPVIEFVSKAAADKNVLAIKQTLYRVSGNSPIIIALANAADNGKQVTVLVELKARFDEENNINWARMLEKAGCHVIYGLVGLKTHSKITLVVRREEDGIRRYVHLGTGNYNDSTAKLYTDLGMFTARESYGEDATAVFNMLSGYSEPPFWKRFVVAPLWMKDIFLRKISKCEEAAKAGSDVRIIAKMNSLSDKDIICALYAASCAGVKIDLIVRGICCLKVGIKGVSENITVRSIVGTFLEHARIFDFRIDNDEEIFLGSADWMNRNLEKRVEIVFPVADEDIIKSIRHYLDVELEDNVKASILLPDNSYEKVKRAGNAKKNSQAIFIKEANQIYDAAIKVNKIEDNRTFVPLQGE